MIGWDMINSVASAAAVAIAPIAALVWRRSRARALARNAAGECAVCGTPWHDIGVAPTEYTLHGTTICASCAHRYRGRTVFQLMVLATATVCAAVIALPQLPTYA